MDRSGEIHGTIAYEKVTHLNVAFENPVDAAGTMSFAEDSPGLIVRAHTAGVKVLVSIGGGSASGDAEMKARYAGLLSAKNRAAFAGRLAEGQIPFQTGPAIIPWGRVAGSDPGRGKNGFR